jgi:hypothetical protein
MTQAEQLALARLKNLHAEAVDTAFYLERSDNKILQAVAYSIKMVGQAIYQLNREALKQATEAQDVKTLP